MSEQESHITGKNYSLWVEIPALCPLECNYCFAETNRPNGGASARGNANLDYEQIIKDFARITRDAGQTQFEVAVPARGEPFFSTNVEVIKSILEVAKNIEGDKHEFDTIKQVRVIIFTAADLLEEDATKIAQEYAKEDYCVTILVKCNCNLIITELPLEIKDISDNRKPDGVYLQDILAGTAKNRPKPRMEGAARKYDNFPYTENRNAALKAFIYEYLIKPKQKDDTRSLDRRRVGIVTSLVEENVALMNGTKRPWVAQYLAFARSLGEAIYGPEPESKKKFIFDCDTLLHHGSAEKTKEDPAPHVKRAVFRLLQDEDREQGINWAITPTYVGGGCHRFDRHVYVELNGVVRPCVGSRRITFRQEQSGVKFDIQVGTPGSASLYEWWKSGLAECGEASPAPGQDPLFPIIHEHKYFGSCSTCLNFLTRKCFSCLGRATTDRYRDDEIRKLGYVETKGCWNHRDDPSELLDRCCNVLRSANNLVAGKSSSEAPFWQPLVRTGQTQELWSGSATFAKDVCMLDHLQRTIPSSGDDKKIDQADLLGHALFHAVKRIFVKEEMPDPEVFGLGFVDIAGEHQLANGDLIHLSTEEREECKTKVLWVTAFIYDYRPPRREPASDYAHGPSSLAPGLPYFVRTFYHPFLERAKYYDIPRRSYAVALRLLMRWFDLRPHLRKGKSWQEQVTDLSDEIRSKQLRQNAEVADYALVNANDSATTAALPKSIYVRNILQNKVLQTRIRESIRRYMDTGLPGVEEPQEEVVDALSKNGYSGLDSSQQSAVTRFFEGFPLFPLDETAFRKAIVGLESDYAALRTHLKKLTEDLGLSELADACDGEFSTAVVKLMNYFLWLGAIYRHLGSYEVFFSHPIHHVPIGGAHGEDGMLVSGRQSFFGLVVATTGKLTDATIYYIRNLLHYVFHPLKECIQDTTIEQEAREAITAEKNALITGILRDIRMKMDLPFLPARNLSAAYSRCFNLGATRTVTHNGFYTMDTEDGGCDFPSDGAPLGRAVLGQLDLLREQLVTTGHDADVFGKASEWSRIVDAQLTQLDAMRQAVSQDLATVVARETEASPTVLKDGRKTQFQRTSAELVRKLGIEECGYQREVDFEVYFPLETVLKRELDELLPHMKKHGGDVCVRAACYPRRGDWSDPVIADWQTSGKCTRMHTFEIWQREAFRLDQRHPDGKADHLTEALRRAHDDYLSLLFGDLVAVELANAGNGYGPRIYVVRRWEVYEQHEFHANMAGHDNLFVNAVLERLKEMGRHQMCFGVIWAFRVIEALDSAQFEKRSGKFCRKSVYEA